MAWSAHAQEPAAAPPAEVSQQAAAPATMPRNQSPEQLQLGTTEIRGNQELPRVLYILPWKRPEMGEGLDRPGNSLIDEALEPVDRVEFRRELKYRDSLQDPGN
jgi:hypothetical protein